MKNNYFIKFISLFLVISILVSNLFACITPPNEENNYTQTPTGGQVVDPSTDSNTNTNEKNPDDTTNNQGTIPEDGEDIEQLGSSFISNDWHDYVGDLETFTYGLIIKQLEQRFDVFSGFVQISTGEIIYGIAYTDFSECYTNDDETIRYIFAGFIPYYGEEAVPDSDFNNGLYIYSYENIYENMEFIFSYKAEEIWDHCVVFNSYLKYGINSDGCVDFIAEDYVRGRCDESLGSLYSYDESRYVYDVDFGKYYVITGETLSVKVNYDELEEEINKLIIQQEINYSQAEVETALNLSIEAFNSYLLSLQEETFLGYDVDYLIDSSKSLDYLDCFQITPDGLILLNINEYSEQPSDAYKLVTGVICISVLATNIVVDGIAKVLNVKYPGLANVVGGITGASTGAAIDIALQVIIDNKTLENVDWNRVVISAVSGAISGAVSPYLNSIKKPGLKYISNIAIDAVLGGTEAAVITWFDGGSATEIVEQFGTGFALAAVFSAVLNIFSFADDIKTNKDSKLAENADKLTDNLSSASKNIRDKTGDFASDASKSLDSNIAKAEYALKETVNEFSDNPDFKKAISDKSINRLPKNNLFDADGNKVLKSELKNNITNLKDGDVACYFKTKAGDMITVKKQNGILGPVFENYPTLDLGAFLSSKRNLNFKKFAELFMEELKVNPSIMPDELMDELLKKYSKEQIMNFTPTKFRDVIKASGWVLHENIDGRSISLVPRYLHDVASNGISHYGGYALMKNLKAFFANTKFADIINSASLS